MELQKSKGLLLIISMIALIIFISLFCLNIFEEHPEPPSELIRMGYRPIPIHRLFLSPMLLIFAMITISYYFVSKRLEGKLEKNLEIISRLISKNKISSKTKQKELNNKNVLLKFLNVNERKVVEKLIEKKGATLQAEISWMEGMSKLKAHRAVKDLERKGLIKTESHGKTKRIMLTEDIKNIMLS